MDADEHVAGYTIFEDFSAREIQFREMQARLGRAKEKDIANGFGPYLVTADAFELTVEGLGTLSHRIVESASSGST